MSSDSPKPSFKSVEVNIFNQVYSLRTNRDAEHIKRIAGLVDERMRLISAHATAHDLAKIAIFAALNLADELSDTREHYEREFQRLLADAATTTTTTAPPADNGEEAMSAAEPERVEDNATAEPRKPDDRQSWFEDIFDAPESETARNRSERLSSKVSAKLQSLRQPPKQETSFAIEDDD